MVVISLRVTAEYADTVEDLARRAGVSMAEWFRQAIAEKMDRERAHDPA